MADLMTTVKAIRPYTEVLIEELKGIPNCTPERDRIYEDYKDSIRPFYILVARECSFDMFINLCFLDLKFNFVAGGMANSEGDTEIEIK